MNPLVSMMNRYFRGSQFDRSRNRYADRRVAHERPWVPVNPRHGELQYRPCPAR